MSTPVEFKRVVFTLDCPDARALAEFYAQLLGWRVDFSGDEPEWVDVLPPENEDRGFAIAFQEVERYRAPEWPDGPTPQQAHFDFYVDSIEAAAVHAEKLGATRHAVQPSETGSFLVLTDPVGHPFCLCLA